MFFKICCSLTTHTEGTPELENDRTQVEQE